jgi:peptidoglycan/xylan/chitin deacetylase (PgdA/CDA1 family)
MLAPEIVQSRFDRWLTLSVAAPLTTWRGGATHNRIPVLMYHSVADEVDADVHPYFRTVTTPRIFARHMRLLRCEGFEAVTLSEAAALLADRERGAGAPLTRKVVITFDDGFYDFREAALPILLRAGYTATVFVSSGFIGQRFLTGRPCLRASDLHELAALGIEIGSHSHTHTKLVELNRSGLEAELRGSRATLEDCTGRAVTTFSYPYRFPEANLRFTAMLAELLPASGYAAGVTTSIGRSGPRDNRLFLPRLPVNDCDDDTLFGAKLAGHYDWLRFGQCASKYSKRLLQPWSRA